MSVPSINKYSNGLEMTTLLDKSKPFKDQFESVGIDTWLSPDMSILNTRETPPNLPLEVFSVEWRQWIQECADAKGCSPDFIVASLLCTVAGMIGNARRGSPWEGWNEPTILWCALVGLPSSGKSPAMDAVLEPIYEIEQELAKEYSQALPKYETDKARAKVRREKWEESLAKSPNNEAMTMPAEAMVPEKPIRPRLVIVDTTIEEAARLLKGNPKGLILCKDELSGLMENFSRRGGNDRPFYLEAFGGRPYVVDRVKNDEPIIIPSLSLSLMGGIQPDKLHTLVINSSDDGLAARILYFWPGKTSFGRPKSILDELMISRAFRRLHHLQPSTDGGGNPSSQILEFEPQASKSFEKWYVKQGEREENVQGILASHIGKFPGFVVRLSVVLTYLEWAIMLEGTSEPKSIERRFIEQAIKLIEDYCLPMAKRCFSDASLPQETRDSKILAQYILKDKPLIMNVSELGRMKGSPLRDPNRLTAALHVLEEIHWVRFVGGRIGPNKGRERKDYEVNPRLFGSFSGG